MMLTDSGGVAAQPSASEHVRPDATSLPSASEHVRSDATFLPSASEHARSDATSLPSASEHARSDATSLPSASEHVRPDASYATTAGLDCSPVTPPAAAGSHSTSHHRPASAGPRRPSRRPSLRARRRLVRPDVHRRRGAAAGAGGHRTGPRQRGPPAPRPYSACSSHRFRPLATPRPAIGCPQRPPAAARCAVRKALRGQPRRVRLATRRQGAARACRRSQVSPVSATRRSRPVHRRPAAPGRPTAAGVSARPQQATVVKPPCQHRTDSATLS